MKTTSSFLATVAIALAASSFFFTSSTLRAQTVEVEVDPIAYALKGFSVHGALASENVRVDLGVFGIGVPEGFHGNTGMTQYSKGLGLKAQYFFDAERSGAFVGIGTDYSWSTFGDAATNAEVTQGAPSVGINLGYRFNIGTSGLYIVPWLGLDYTFASKTIDVGTKTFSQSSFRPFPTVHIGWKF